MGRGGWAKEEGPEGKGWARAEVTSDRAQISQTLKKKAIALSIIVVISVQNILRIPINQWE